MLYILLSFPGTLSFSLLLHSQHTLFQTSVFGGLCYLPKCLRVLEERLLAYLHHETWQIHFLKLHGCSCDPRVTARNMKMLVTSYSISGCSPFCSTMFWRLISSCPLLMMRLWPLLLPVNRYVVDVPLSHIWGFGIN